MKRFIAPIVAILILILLAVSSRFELTRYISLGAMKSLMSRVSPYEPLLFMTFCMAAVVLRLPIIFLIALGGALFGVLQGLLYGWIGSMVGAFGAFLLARYALKEFFQQRVAPRFPWLGKLDARLASNGLRTILLLRLFLFMSPPTNWITGLSRVKFRDYAIGTMIGPLPLMILLNYWGGQIAEADSLWVLTRPRILVPGLLVLLLVVCGSLLFHKRIASALPRP